MAGRQLWTLRADLDASRPLSPGETDERFRELGGTLQEIHALEVAAVDAFAERRRAAS